MFHKHKYDATNWTYISVWDFEKTGAPNRIDTEFGLICKKCGKASRKRYKGFQFSAEEALMIVEANGWTCGTLVE